MKSLAILLLLFFQLMSCNAKLQQATHPLEPIRVDHDTLAAPIILNSEDKHIHFHLPYQMSEPINQFKMPEVLKEISGLSMSAINSKSLTAIQDEQGKLFYINKDSGEIEQEITFYKDGDYEGIEVVRDTVYVVKSTGTIYEVCDLEQSPPYVRKHKFFLSKENDVEGMCYDANENRLLIACKGMPNAEETEKENKFKKAIYSFYLEDKRMELEPTFLFSLSDLQNHLQVCKESEHHEKLCSYFNPDVESLIFSPSAIAVHPLTGNIYMTSSPKKILMVFDPKGNILHLEKMDKKIHPQPEGLTFDRDGTLYMANEGKEGQGTVLRFKYQPDLSKHQH